MLGSCTIAYAFVFVRMRLAAAVLCEDGGTIPQVYHGTSAPLLSSPMHNITGGLRHMAQSGGHQLSLLLAGNTSISILH